MLGKPALERQTILILMMQEMTGGMALVSAGLYVCRLQFAADR